MINGLAYKGEIVELSEDTMTHLIQFIIEEADNIASDLDGRDDMSHVERNHLIALSHVSLSIFGISWDKLIKKNL